ncbi:MAG: GNAT family N-acetyltransferase [Anaerolineales bacterium]|nr:GNAT family N-acetyltransferase [Anaerolineales bacterium]
MSTELREMRINDYEKVHALWEASEGVGLSDADSKENIYRYLKRNPGLSTTAWEGDQVVGAVLCGHDGRRGYIHHLAVNKSHRHQGIGRALVERCLDSLARVNIGKCHIFVFGDNQDAINFWEKVDWSRRIELVIMSKQIPTNS